MKKYETFCSFGSHSAHFVQFFNVLIQALSCVWQCKIPEQLFNCVFLPNKLGGVSIGNPCDSFHILYKH